MLHTRRALLDTDVWTQLFVLSTHRDERAAHWRELLVGATVAIAAQTRAEVLAGLLIANWGQIRLAQARVQLDAVATIPVDEPVIQQYAQLKAECQRSGHALHHKVHSADRWIAATAAVHGLPLLSVDGIFHGVPGLRLLGEAAQ